MNTAGYGHIDCLPSDNSEFEGSSFFGGYNKIVRINISPLIYIPSSNTFDFITEFKISLSWEVDSCNSNLLYPLDSKNREQWENRSKSIVINPECVEGNISNSSDRFSTLLSSPDRIRFDYIIVTNKELSTAFDRLASIRKAKGFRSSIFLIEDILEDERFEKGDTVSGINDDAGKLRAFLSYAYTTLDTKFVLLGGDSSIIPVRFGYGLHRLLSSDLYYCELNQSWSVMGDSNQPGDCKAMTDFDCELYCGRLNCTTVEEVNNYIDKVEIYEFNPENNDLEYLNNAFLAVGENLGPDFRPNQFNPLENIFKQIFPNLTEHIQKRCDEPTGKEVIDSINKSQYGFIDFIGHGSPEGVTTTDNLDIRCNNTINNHGINALDKERPYLYVENGNGLDCINNKYYPNWTYSLSCSVMPLAYSERQADCNVLSYNFGESYTLGKDYGGVAIWGATEDTYTASGFLFHTEFFKHLQNTFASGEMAFIGPLGCYMKTIIPSKDNSEYKLEHNLMGDPLINIWNGKPYTLRELETNTSIGKLTLGKFNLFTPGLIQRDSIAAPLNFKIENNIIYTVYGANLLPYIYPLTIRNIELSGIYSFYANNINFGNTYNYSPIAPTITISEGSEINIFSFGEVVFKETTLFKEGCCVNIHSNKPVTVNNIIIEKDAILSIIAPSINLNSNINVKSGGKLNILNKIPYE